MDNQILEVFSKDTGEYIYRAINEDDLLLQNSEENKDQKQGEIKTLVFTKEQSLYKIRQLIKQNKNSLEKIILNNVLLKQDFFLLEKLNLQYMSPIDALTMLFRQEDITISSFPNLTKLIIDITDQKTYFKEESTTRGKKLTKKEQDDLIRENTRRQLLQRTYQELKKEVLDTLDSHIKLKNYMSPQKVILINYTFQSMETFNYAYNFMENNFDQIKYIIFRNIKTLRKESFNKLKQVILKQQQLTEMSFEYTFLNNFHIQLIRDMLGQKREQITSIRFIQCGLNELDIKTLFFDHIQITDFPALENIEIERNPLLIKSKYIYKIQQYVNANRKNLSKVTCVAKLKNCVSGCFSCCMSKEDKVLPEDIGITIQNFHFFLEPKNLIFDNYFNSSNQAYLVQILRVYSDQDCLQSLSLEGFSLQAADKSIVDSLQKIMTDQKASIIFNLSNTQITREQLSKIAQGLGPNKKILVSLKLNQNMKYQGSVTQQEEDIFKTTFIEDEFNNNQSVIRAKLDQNFWLDPLKYFFSLAYPYILNLSLVDCGLTNQDLSVISEGILFASKNYTHGPLIFLEKLDLSQNQFETNHKKFYEMNRTRHLKTQKSAKQKMAIYVSKGNEVKLLINAILEKTQLEQLVLRDCGLSDKLKGELRQHITTVFKQKQGKTSRGCCKSDEDKNSFPFIMILDTGGGNALKQNLKRENYDEQTARTEYDIDVQGIQDSKRQLLNSQSSLLQSKMYIRSIPGLKSNETAVLKKSQFNNKKQEKYLELPVSSQKTPEKSIMMTPIDPVAYDDKQLLVKDGHKLDSPALKNSQNFNFNGETPQDNNNIEDENNISLQNMDYVIEQYIDKYSTVKNQEGSIYKMVQSEFDQKLIPAYELVDIEIFKKDIKDKAKRKEFENTLQKQKPKDFFQSFILQLKTLKIHPEEQDNDKPDKYYLEILQGLQKGIREKYNAKEDDKKFTNDTASIPLVNFDISNCRDLPVEFVKSIAILLVLEVDSGQITQQDTNQPEESQENKDQQQQDSEIQENENLDLGEQLVQKKIAKLQDIYTKQYLSIENEEYVQEVVSTGQDPVKQREDFYLKIDKIILENYSQTTKPETIGKILQSIGWSSGPFLTKIQLGNLDQQAYSQQLSIAFRQVAQRLQQYRGQPFIPQQLKLKEIEFFPQDFVKTFLTYGENGRGLKIINGQAMFYDLQQTFIELVRSNQVKNMLLESFIFHYKACFGISSEDRKKLLFLLKKSNKTSLKYVDMLNKDDFDIMNEEEQKEELERRTKPSELMEDEEDLKQMLEINHNGMADLGYIKEQRKWINLKKIEFSRGDVNQGKAKVIMYLNEELNLYRVEIRNFFMKKQNIIACLKKNDAKNQAMEQPSQKEIQDEKFDINDYSFDHEQFKRLTGEPIWKIPEILTTESEFKENEKKYKDILLKIIKDGRDERLQLKFICNEYPYVDEICAAIQSRFKKKRLKLSYKKKYPGQKSSEQAIKQRLFKKYKHIYEKFTDQYPYFKEYLNQNQNQQSQRYDSFLKYILTYKTAPKELYIDSTFTDNLLLGCMGIYPENSSKYSFFLNSDFFSLCENKKISLKAHTLQFIPTLLDEKFEIIGGEDVQYILTINKKLKHTNIGRTILNYSYISNEPLKNVAIMNNQIQSEKTTKINRLKSKIRFVKRNKQMHSKKKDKEKAKIELDKLDKQEYEYLQELQQEQSVILPPSSEAELLDLFQRMPPSKVEVKNLSINALKLLYVISYENPNFQSAVIEYDSRALVNNGVSYSLSDYFSSPQMSAKGLSKVKYIFLNIFKGIFGFFVSKDVIYKFDESVIALNKFLDYNKIYYTSMMVMIMLYWIIGSVCPLYLTHSEGILNSGKGAGRGVSWVSHGIWAFFMFITAVMETYMYIQTLKQMSHLTPPLKMSPGSGFITEKINQVKAMVINLKWFNYQYLLYGKNLWRSQNLRFDFYSDVSFIVVCIQSNFNDLAFISALVLGITVIHNLMQYITIIKDIIVNRHKPKLGTHHINKFYESAVFLEFAALGDVLDVVAPYNVVGIPNNALTRFFIPSYCGQSVSRKMINTGTRIFLEDIPQIVLQSLYMSRTTEEDFIVYLGFASSMISIVDALGVFLSTRPSIITQMDFDRLSYRRQQEKNQTYNQFKLKQAKMYDDIKTSYYDATGNFNEDKSDEED